MAAWVPKPPTEIFWCDRCGALARGKDRHQDGWDAHFTCMGPMIELVAQPCGPEARAEWDIAWKRWEKQQKKAEVPRA